MVLDKVIKYILISTLLRLTYTNLANQFSSFANNLCLYKYIFLAHYALATRNTDLALFLLKIMTDVNVPTFEPHLG